MKPRNEMVDKNKLVGWMAKIVYWDTHAYLIQSAAIIKR